MKQQKQYQTPVRVVAYTGQRRHMPPPTLVLFARRRRITTR